MTAISNPALEARQRTRDLAPLMRPRSVAVIGASPRPEALGSRVLRNLAVAGFRGPVFPVHPSASLIDGRPCFASLADLPETPECVAIALPADKVLAALRDSEQRGARAAVVFASGFAESGEAGRGLQRALAQFCERSGMLVCGPNVLGVRNLHDQFALYSAPLPLQAMPGGVAVAAHSGSACVALSSTGRFGLSHVVSMGNAVDLDADDYLEFFAGDPHTRVACLFLETVRHPQRLAAAAARMRAADKQVVALKVGRTAHGAAASAAHTGSLATSHDAAQAYFRDAGIVLVEDLDEMVETCTLMTRTRKRPTARGVAVINISGGEVALTCDLGQAVGVEFPALSPATAEALRAILPAYATPGNPLDATSAALAEPAIYENALRALLDDPAVGLLAVSQDCPAGLADEAAAGYRKLAAVAAKVEASASKPIVFYSNVGGALHPATLEPLVDSGVPVLQGARAALAGIRGFVDWHLWEPPARAMPQRVVVQAAWKDRLQTGKPLSEHEAKRFLRDHGIRTTREAVAHDAQQAGRIAQEIGFPVVAKVNSPDIAHKTEAGGVALALACVQDVERAFDRIVASVREHAPAARIDGVVIQEMVRDGVELIAGTAHYPPFGPGVIVGSGGILVELVKDSSLALCPLDPQAARALVARTRACALLDGFRGAAPADRPAFEDIVARLSAIAEAYVDCIEAIDLNPVAVLGQGQGACVLDALVVPRTPGSATPPSTPG